MIGEESRIAAAALVDRVQWPGGVGVGQNMTGGCTIFTDFDSYGRVHDVTDADGYTTTCSYDDPAGTVTQTVTVVDLTTTPSTTITTSCLPDLLAGPCKRPTATAT